MNNPIIFIVLAMFSVLALTSCQAGKKALKQGNDLQIKTAYLQEVIPGVEGMAIEDWLYLELETYNTDECSVDSVYYKNNVFYIKNQKQIYQLDQNKGSQITSSDILAPGKEDARIFYHKNNKGFYMDVSGIYRKETINLPAQGQE